MRACMQLYWTNMTASLKQRGYSVSRVSRVAFLDILSLRGREIQSTISATYFAF